jgi:hypothetical protein
MPGRQSGDIWTFFVFWAELVYDEDGIIRNTPQLIIVAFGFAADMLPRRQPIAL